MISLPVPTSLLDPQTGKWITFVQFDEPPLKADEYEVTVTQTNSNTSYNSFTETRQFAVSGERFSFQSAEIDSVFPPNLANGEFDGVFAHAVLNRLTLPWERYLTQDNDSAPWLAVLVFNESENPTIQKSKASDLIKNGEPITVYGNASLTGTGNIPEGTVSYPNINPLDYGESPDDECYTIDISVNLFNEIVPSLNDIPYLAHIREVSTVNGLDASDVIAKYAVVLANRLPQDNATSYAYLISLENMGPYLPKEDGTPSGNIPAGTTTIRLISYKNWQFTANDLDQNLQQLLENLNKKTYGSNTFTSLQYPFSDTPPTQADVQSALTSQQSGTLSDADAKNLALNALSLGYTPLSHHMRHGDQTVSWYRGPLVPYQTNTKINIPISCADAVNRYNPETGLFDVSYGAAWQLGRLMALQNNSYSVALYQWKKAVTDQEIAQEEQNLLLSKTEGLTFFKSLIDNRSKILDTPIPVPQIVTDWITGLHLLNGVPFNYLIPDENMFPVESLKFFNLDINWINALIDGAFSIGRASTNELHEDQKRLSYIKTLALRNVPLRRKNRKINLTYINTSGVYSGFLMRSLAVSGWPNLQVNGYADAEGTIELPLLRVSALSESILLVIFDGPVNMVAIHEPPEQLHCGVEPVSPSSGLSHKFSGQTTSFTTTLRQLTGATPGQQYTDPSDVAPIILRSDGQTLQIQPTAESIRTKLNQLAVTVKIPPIPPENFTSAEYALEMNKGVIKVEYVNTAIGLKL